MIDTWGMHDKFLVCDKLRWKWIGIFVLLDNIDQKLGNHFCRVLIWMPMFLFPVVFNNRVSMNHCASSVILEWKGSNFHVYYGTMQIPFEGPSALSASLSFSSWTEGAWTRRPTHWADGSLATGFQLIPGFHCDSLYATVTGPIIELHQNPYGWRTRTGGSLSPVCHQSKKLSVDHTSKRTYSLVRPSTDLLQGNKMQLNIFAPFPISSTSFCFCIIHTKIF